MASESIPSGSNALSNTSLAASDRAEAFIRALYEFEQSGAIQDLLQQFVDDCELHNKPREELYRGPKGVRQFWHTYRAQFETLNSLFTHVLETNDHAVLEWCADGRCGPGDKTWRYNGVFIIEFDQADRIKRCRIYYDASILVMQRVAATH